MRRVLTVLWLAISSALVVPAATNGAHAVTGHQWHAPHAVEAKSLQQVVCTSARFCIARDAANRTVTYRNGAWGTPSRSLQTVTSSYTYALYQHAMGCAPSTSFCVVAGYDHGAAAAAVSIFNGTSWRPWTDLPDSETLTAVSCTSRIFCLALGDAGYAYAYNGSTWAYVPAHTQTQAYTWTSVDCASTHFCKATGQSGRVQVSETFNGSKLSAFTTVTRKPAASVPGGDVVSCPTTAWCAASRSWQNAGLRSFVTSSAGSWSPRGVFARGGVGEISCAARGVCQGVDGGYTVRLNGVRHRADRLARLTSISCPTRSFCMAVDAKGHALAYR